MKFDPETLKKSIFDQLQNLVDEKIKTVESIIHSVEESRDNETKSSAGDKYETGRAMMQLELDKSKAQLLQYFQLKKELNRINLAGEYTKGEFGTLILTNNGNYFLSVGLGKIEHDGQKYYAVSLASPIGKVLHNKKPGEKTHFQDKEFLILEIH